MRDDNERIKDILEAISQIEKYAPKGKRALEAEELVQVWMVHHLRIIGEAARTLSDTVKKQLKEVPWKGIIGMRTLYCARIFQDRC